MKKHLICWIMTWILLITVLAVPCLAAEPVTGKTEYALDSSGEGEGSEGGAIGEGENPGGGSTENPGGGSTENPGGGSTENPGGGSTENPGGGSTENPGGGSTENPGGGSTETPGGGNTETPGSGNTETPGGNGGTTGGNGGTQKPGTSGGNSATTTQKPAAAPVSSQHCEHNFPEWEARSWAHIRTCRKCGAFESVKHTYSNRYVEDGEGHWLVCDVCAYQRDFYDHHYSNKLESDAFGHWEACSECGAVKDMESHIPGPGANETRDQLCTVCGYVMVPRITSGNGGTEGADWENDELTHWQLDEAGGKRQESLHKWDDGSRHPDGSLIYSCEVCGYLWIDDGSENAGGFAMGAMAAAFIAVVLILAVILVVLLFKLKNPGRYSGHRGRRS